MVYDLLATRINSSYTRAMSSPACFTRPFFLAIECHEPCKRAKLWLNPPRGFGPTYAKYTPKLRRFTSLFSQFFRKSTDALVGPIFTLRHTTWLCAECLVGGEKINF